jgi:hypothetical protein
MAAIAFTKFDPVAALAKAGTTAAKVAKPAKADPNFSDFSNFSRPGSETRERLPSAVAPGTLPDEERSAIIETDAGVPRDWAEGYASLLRAPVPAGVTPSRWQLFIDDVGRFLDRWARRANELGWDPFDLFGCDAVKPFARIDRQGLLWLLQGSEIGALTENSASIKTPKGVALTYRRKTEEPGRVLAWELTGQPQARTAQGAALGLKLGEAYPPTPTRNFDSRDSADSSVGLSPEKQLLDFK